MQLLICLTAAFAFINIQAFVIDVPKNDSFLTNFTHEFQVVKQQIYHSIDESVKELEADSNRTLTTGASAIKNATKAIQNLPKTYEAQINKMIDKKSKNYKNVTKCVAPFVTKVTQIPVNHNKTLNACINGYNDRIQEYVITTKKTLRNNKDIMEALATDLLHCTNTTCLNEFSLKTLHVAADLSTQLANDRTAAARYLAENRAKIVACGNQEVFNSTVQAAGYVIDAYAKCHKSNAVMLGGNSVVAVLLGLITSFYLNCKII